MTHPNDLRTDRYYDGIGYEPKGPPEPPEPVMPSMEALRRLTAELLRWRTELTPLAEIPRHMRDQPGECRAYDKGRTDVAEAVLHELGITADVLGAWDDARQAYSEGGAA